jgi:TetR/AcrR family transcriptional regulator, transcriptional repressor of bet genes
MPRPSNRRLRRAQILEAFARVVARHGYTGATIPQVAEQAGLAPGLIHYHFENKQELLLELLRHLRGVVSARRRQPPVGDARRQLDAFIDAHLSREGEDRLAVACWQVLGAEALHDQELGREFRRAVRSQLRQLEGILRGGALVPEGQVRPAAAAILAAIQGCFSLAATNPRAIPKGTAAASVRRMARGLLRAPRR